MVNFSSKTHLKDRTSNALPRSIAALRQLLFLSSCCGTLSAGAVSITNVQPVNVTPSSFSILWRITNSTPSIAVFSDANASSNLAGQLQIEAFPLHTGNPDLAAGYARRLNQMTIRQNTQTAGQMLVRVGGCRPNTVYYYRLTSTPSSGAPVVYPASGPLPSVTTAKENTFVIDDQQLVIDITGVSSLGGIITLSNAAAAYPLAAVVGDGVGTNQAFFNVNDLFLAAGGGGNFAPLGPQQFTIDAVGPNGQPDNLAGFTMNFGTNLLIAGVTNSTYAADSVKLSLGSTALQTGQSAYVPILLSANAIVVDLSLVVKIPPGHMSNVGLQNLAPQIDPASVTVTPQGGGSYLFHLGAFASQAITGTNQIAQLTFTASAGQHSAYVPFLFQQITAVRGNGSLVTNLFGLNGRVIVIGPEPMMEAIIDPSGARNLALFGIPYSSYAVEYATNLSAPVAWTRLPYSVSLTSISSPVQGATPTPPRVYYRAVQISSDQPYLEAGIVAGGQRQLTLHGTPGNSYQVQYATFLGGTPILWTALTNIPLTNSVTYIQVTPPGGKNRAIFYRAQKN